MTTTYGTADLVAEEEGYCGEWDYDCGVHRIVPEGAKTHGENEGAEKFKE